MSLDHKAQGYDLDDALGKAGGDPDAPDLKSEAAFRLRQARAYARIHAPELLLDPDVRALDEWRADSNLHRAWEMTCPFDGEECILHDTREGQRERDTSGHGPCKDKGNTNAPSMRPRLPPCPDCEADPRQITLFRAQCEQPWTVPYGENKWWVTNNEGRLKHCLAHAQKSLGKIAAIVERLDHVNQQWLSDAECDEVGDMAADLVSVALQIGTTVSKSIAHALARRVIAKNGKLFDRKGGTYGRALICT